MSGIFHVDKEKIIIYVKLQYQNFQKNNVKFLFLYYIKIYLISYFKLVHRLHVWYEIN